jgi:hypothetical protein
MKSFARLEADSPQVLGEEQRSILLRDNDENCRGQWRSAAAEETMREVREDPESVVNDAQEGDAAVPDMRRSVGEAGPRFAPVWSFGRPLFQPPATAQNGFELLRQAPIQRFHSLSPPPIAVIDSPQRNVLDC